MERQITEGISANKTDLGNSLNGKMILIVIIWMIWQIRRMCLI